MSKATITPYLLFDGCCEDAVTFYRKALDAQVEMMVRYNESPDPPPPGMLPPGYENKVMHVSFRIQGHLVMASDDCVLSAKPRGFRLSLALPTEGEVVQAFDALAEGGSIDMPVGQTFWSPAFGMLTDRFGIGWMVTMIPSEAA